jgi:hypothetical protein
MLQHHVLNFRFILVIRIEETVVPFIGCCANIDGAASGFLLSPLCRASLKPGPGRKQTYITWEVVSRNSQVASCLPWNAYQSGLEHSFLPLGSMSEGTRNSLSRMAAPSLSILNVEVTSFEHLSSVARNEPWKLNVSGMIHSRTIAAACHIQGRVRTIYQALHSLTFDTASFNNLRLTKVVINTNRVI